MRVTPTLITIPISHFCEKARWALDRGEIAHVERAHLQVLHRFALRRAGGGRTAPALVTPEGVIADSAGILAYADARTAPDRRIYPADLDAAAAIRTLERDLDEGLGPDGRLWMYFELRGRRDIALRYATTGVPAWERRLFPLGYPLVARIIDHILAVTPEAAARAERRVDAVFDDIATRLADGRPYLMGERFSAADLTFSALAASVLMPPEYGVPLPQPEVLPERMSQRIRGWRAHPAGAHALRMFRDERRG